MRIKNKKLSRISIFTSIILVYSLLTGCGILKPKVKNGENTINVNITDNSCTISSNTIPSGTVNFVLNNTGSQVNEFEILAEDQLRIVGERENLIPNSTVNYTATLAPGTYYSACKVNMVGDYIDLTKITVNDSGEKIVLPKDLQVLQDRAIISYIAYIKDQTGHLLPKTKDFVKLYLSGNITTAKAAYPFTRQYYERIEPTAEAFGDIDPALDSREADLNASQKPHWTGWHAIEKDLWQTNPNLNYSPKKREYLGNKLISDTQRLYDKVYDKNFTLRLDDVSNGAISLLEEVAVTKITGEEEIFSHTDLYDFFANVQGAKVAFDLVKPIAVQEDKTIVTEIDKRFNTLMDLLQKYQHNGVFVNYLAISNNPKNKRQLSDAINALRVPLSKITELVLSKVNNANEAGKNGK